MRVAWAALKAGRWHYAILCAIPLAVTAVVTGSTTVEVPALDRLLPLPLLLSVGALAVTVVPLYSTFGALEGTLARARRTRIFSVVGAWLLGALTCLPATRAEGGGVALVICWLVVATMAVVIVGELAWLICFTIGLATVFADPPPTYPVTAAIEAIPTGLLALLLLGVGLLYVWRGPATR